MKDAGPMALDAPQLVAMIKGPSKDDASWAFRQLVTRYWAEWYRFARGCSPGRMRDDLEDILQTALAKLFAARKTLTGGSISRFVKTTIQRCILNEIRRRERRPEGHSVSMEDAHGGAATGALDKSLEDRTATLRGAQ